MSVRKLSTASILSPAYKNSKIWDGTTFPGYFESIATVVVDASGSSSILFSNIPQNYAHLQIRYTARTSRSSTDGDYMRVRFNGDTTNNYSSQHWIGGDGANVSAGYDGASGAGIYVERLTAASQLASAYGVGVIDILDYTSTSKTKVLRYLTGADINGTFTAYNVRQGSGMWLTSNTAISSITIDVGVGPNFAQYSTFALYGIRGA